MTWVTRAQWGARAPSGAGNAIAAHPVGVAIHWEGPPMGTRPHSECDDTVRGIQNYHMDSQGWSDIAYNILVCEHGYEFEGRGKGRGSAANGSSTANANYYAVCAIVGDGDPQPAALHNGIRSACDRVRSWGAGDVVVGHRDLYATACPGEQLYGMVHAGAFDAGASNEQEDDMGDVTVVGMSGDVAQVISKAVWERYKPGGENLATIIGEMREDVNTIRAQLDALIAALTE